MKKETLLQIISYALCILFIYAATVKLMEYDTFVTDMSRSPLLANIHPPFFAPFVLGLEILAAVLVCFPAVRLSGLFLSGFLMLAFSVYMSVLYFFYTNIPCSCGGILGYMSYPVHIVFNIVFTLIAFTGIILQHFLLSSPSTQKTTV